MGDLKTCLIVSGRRALPVRSDEKEVAGLGSSGALAYGGEHICPHVHNGHRIVTIMGVGDRKDDRLLSKVHPSSAPQRVETDAHHYFPVGTHIVRHFGKLIHRCCGPFRVGSGCGG